MALRKPLVLNGGRTQQLQVGDTLDATVAVDSVRKSLTNNNAGSIVIGTPVFSSSAGGVDKGDASAVGTSDIVGLVGDTTIATTASGAIVTEGVLTATTAEWDAVFGTTGGLTFNTFYYLSTTTGEGTATAPVTVGDSVVELGIALSTTQFLVRIRQAILL